MAAPETRKRPAADDVPPPVLDPDGEPGPSGWRLPLLEVLDELEPLSKREARESRATMIKSLIKWGQLIDDGMPLLSRTGREVNIWGNLDEAEAGVLADCLIDLGRRWGVAAQIVRGIVRTYSWLEVGMITVPRFRQSISYYVREGFVLSFRIGGAKR